MTPQSTFMVLAPIADGQVASLRALLATMTGTAPIADPHNPVVPFGQFDRLHFARFVILEGHTTDDIAAYGVTPRAWPPSLVFLGDCDGPADTFLNELVDAGRPGLAADLRALPRLQAQSRSRCWMGRHATPPSASYVNWIGRTVTQIREEAALHAALAERLRAMGDAATAIEPRQLRQNLLEFVAEERRAGRLALTPPAPTPLAWKLANLAHLGVPLGAAGAGAVPAGGLAAASCGRLRWLEREDPRSSRAPTATMSTPGSARGP